MWYDVLLIGWESYGVLGKFKSLVPVVEPHEPDVSHFCLHFKGLGECVLPEFNGQFFIWAVNCVSRLLRCAKESAYAGVVFFASVVGFTFVFAATPTLVGCLTGCASRLLVRSSNEKSEKDNFEHKILL